MIAYKDLREWIKLAEEIGELQVMEGVDPDLEVGGIVQINSKNEGPALLFKALKGYWENYRVLTNVIDRVVKETFRMTQKIRRMNQRLREWDKVLEDMEKMLKEVREQKQETTQRMGAAKNEFWRMEQQIQKEIQASERRRNELEGKIVEEVQKLHAASQRLKLRLKRLKL